MFVFEDGGDQTNSILTLSFPANLLVAELPAKPFFTLFAIKHSKTKKQFLFKETFFKVMLQAPLSY